LRNLTNNPSTISKVIVEPLSLGDHELIGCIRKYNHAKYESKTIRFRDYKSYNTEKLIRDVNTINWKPLYECNDVDIATNYFTESLKSVFDVNAPIKTKTVRGKPAPWLKGSLKRFMDDKDKLLRKARKTKTDDDWNEYRRTRNKCNAKVKEAKRKYHRNLIEDNKSNPRKFWDAIKVVFPSKSKKAADSSAKEFEKKALVNAFSTYFGNVVTELKSKIISFSNYIWRSHTNRTTRTHQTFHFSYVPRIFCRKTT